MKVYLGSDHAGYKLKEGIKGILDSMGVHYRDLGTDSERLVDYPDYARAVVKKVIENRGSRGILICGTGTGMVIAANRMKGVRAVVAYDIYSARMSRVDNDANVLALRGNDFKIREIGKIVRVWLGTDFSKSVRHKRRIRKLDL